MARKTKSKLKSQETPGSAAARKGWATRREAVRKRSEAARQGWKTRRADETARKRSEAAWKRSKAAREGWKTRRAAAREKVKPERAIPEERYREILDDWDEFDRESWDDDPQAFS